MTHARSLREDHEVPGVDGLRGAAALLVVAYHCAIALPSVLGLRPDAPKVILGGGLAVPFFFVISGFLLQLPTARRDGQFGALRRYAERRVARICPPYWAMLFVLFCMWPFVFTSAPSPLASKDGVVAVGVHLAFLQSLLLGPAKYAFTADLGFGVNPAVWSLTNEVVFYAVLPFVGTRFHERPARGLATSLAISLGWRTLCRNLPEALSLVGGPAPADWLGGHLFHQAPAYAWSFGVGMFAAEALVGRRFGWASLRRHAEWLHVVCVVALVGFVHLGGIYDGPGPYYDYVRDLVPAAIVALLILVTTELSAKTRAIYTSRPSRFLGDVSYGVYLFHMLVLQVAWRQVDVARWGVEGGTHLLYATVIPAAVLVGAASYFALERPILRFVRHRQRIRDAEPSATASSTQPALGAGTA
ncbi:MAG TPA: acyltransferase [Polyangiaceae bacterium]|nr:acyltransferase [Polyangiaceae bacterium]